MNRNTHGGTITGVEVQQRRRDRVNVYVDGDFAFALSLPVAQDAGLRRGLVLEESDVRNLLARDESQRAYDSALNFLSYRPRSEAEVRDNLRRKRIEPDLAEQIVARLKANGLIDDAAFARFWVENRDAFSPRGTRALKSELYGKGVSRELIDTATRGRGDEEASACTAGSRKARELKDLDHRTFRQKLGAYLARRGFSYDAVSAAVETLWREVTTEGQVPPEHAAE